MADPIRDKAPAAPAPAPAKPEAEPPKRERLTVRAITALTALDPDSGRHYFHDRNDGPFEIWADAFVAASMIKGDAVNAPPKPAPPPTTLPIHLQRRLG